MRKLFGLVQAAAGATIVSLLAVDPALAGNTPVPGPVIGAGLPALALFGAGYWLIRRRRKN
jgi:LPXTG-motif cell wall-anchored protein